MADKIYVGSGEEKHFPDGGSLIQVTLTLDNMGEYFKQYGFTSVSGKKMIKLKLNKRREIGKFGETHSLEIDTWKPSANNQAQRRQESHNASSSVSPDFPDEIPW